MVTLLLTAFKGKPTCFNFIVCDSCNSIVLECNEESGIYVVKECRPDPVEDLDFTDAVFPHCNVLLGDWAKGLLIALFCLSS